MKLAFLKEKRSSDLRMMVDIMKMALVSYVEDGKRTCKIDTSKK